MAQQQINYYYKTALPPPTEKSPWANSWGIRSAPSQRRVVVYVPGRSIHVPLDPLASVSVSFPWVRCGCEQLSFLWAYTCPLSQPPPQPTTHSLLPFHHSLDTHSASIPSLRIPTLPHLHSGCVWNSYTFRATSPHSRDAHSRWEHPECVRWEAGVGGRDCLRTVVSSRWYNVCI